MKREFPPLYLGIILVLACVIFRLISSHFPGYFSNISPLMAVAFVGAMYLPRRWGWLVVPATLILTELAFLPINSLTDGSGQMFSWWTVASVAIYAFIYMAASGFGLFLARFRSLLLVIGGSVLCSLVFYVVANTISWGYDLAVGMTPGYAPTFAGWLQANTTGVPGFPPTWVFLRNGMAGDLFFAFVLLAVLDCGFLLGHSPAKAEQRAA